MTTSATSAPAPRARFGGSRRAGFTLMEMVLVLLIIALIGAMVYPSTRATWRRALGESSRYELLRLLRHARWWSSNSAMVCTVRLHSSQGRYVAQVSYLPHEGALPQPLRAQWTVLESAPMIESMAAAPAGGTLKEQRELEVRFTPWGVSEDYVIVLGEQEGRPAQIDIRRPSGLVWMRLVDSPSIVDGVNSAALSEYWEAHCRDAGR